MEKKTKIWIAVSLISVALIIFAFYEYRDKGIVVALHCVDFSESQYSCSITEPIPTNLGVMATTICAKDIIGTNANLTIVAYNLYQCAMSQYEKGQCQNPKCHSLMSGLANTGTNDIECTAKCYPYT